MILAVFDTNVLVASLLSKYPDSATVQVVDAITTNKIIPLYSSEIIEEYNQVLHRSKFQLSEESIKHTLSIIQEYGLNVGIPTKTEEILPDEDDVIFFEVVMEKRNDNAYLITGNLKHFPQKPFIVTPAEMMHILLESELKKSIDKPNSIDSILTNLSVESVNSSAEKQSVLSKLKRNQALISQSSQKKAPSKDKNEIEKQ